MTADTWFPKKNVLVPLDFSDASVKAVDSALALVEEASQLHVIHVLPVVVPGDPGFRWNVMDEEALRRQVTETIRQRLNQPEQAGVHVEVAFGDPGHEIAGFAEGSGVDLIVMPSHGRTGLKRLLIGSVAERVTRLAHCPVLVLRTQDE